MQTMLHIINSGVSNLGSIQNMLKKCGVPFKVSDHGSDIASASKLILPGVGAFDKGMSNLNERLFTEGILQKVREENVPILGICLGMQLLLDQSEEGDLPGLGLISGRSKKFNLERKLKVPHMGWNTTKQVKESEISQYLYDENRFYFVHSYYVECCHPEDILMTTNYGGDFTCAIQKNHIFGVQFHPEKSHKFGLAILKRFCEL